MAGRFELPASVKTAPRDVVGLFCSIAAYFQELVSSRRKTLQAVGMIASANVIGTALGIVGSLVQAHFISPDDLGFVRKYSVIAGYAIFLNLGLFSILQREYPVLIGRGEPERARRTAAIVQSWCLLVSGVVCGALSVVTFIELFQGHWREAAAWFIQIVGVWSALYVGYLTCTFRSGQEFTRLATGQFVSSLAGVAVLPLFVWLPFPALVLRSVAGQIVSSVYLHLVRPVKAGWCLPWDEFWNLVKRGMRLYVGTYLRYSFWLTVEIWLMLQVAGDAGVGLLFFSKMIAEAASQISFAINQVYIPRLAQTFGQSGMIRACLQLSAKPTLLNLGISVLVTAAVWFVVPPIISYAFPKYLDATPLLRILVLQTLIVSVSLPLYMVSVLESYLTQIFAAVVGLGVFVAIVAMLYQGGLRGESVAWGTLGGQATFAAVCLFWVFGKARIEKATPNVAPLS